MSNGNMFRVPARKPVVVGTGLVALDVVIDERAPTHPSLWAGGTCGNVLAILSSLGWRAYPVARLNGDEASQRVLRDLAHWNVHLNFATLTPGAETPIVIERIRTNAGRTSHRFSWTCPNCGAWLPSYKPVVGAAAQRVADEMGSPHVFFMDRVSRGAINLARVARERGASVVFEPSGIGDPRLFSEALEFTHVLKYSHERIEALRHRPDRTTIPLEIQTLGAAGIRYRSTIPTCRTSGWHTLEAFDVKGLKDSAGAGDWCTAGIIHLLARGGAKDLHGTTKQALGRALLFGQALASWTCRYTGARGGMYLVDQRVFRREIRAILSDGKPRPAVSEKPTPVLHDVFEKLCSRCTS